MVKRLPGARLLAVAALLAGCINNPSDEPAASLEGEWINTDNYGGWKDMTMMWSRLRVTGDSFHVTFNYANGHCDPDYGTRVTVLRCGDDSAGMEPCTDVCSRCDTLYMKRAVCHFIVDTIGYAYASGRIYPENDSIFNFNGVVSDTVFRRCATGVSDSLSAFSERVALSWCGNDSLLLRTDMDGPAYKGIWMLVRGGK